MTTEAFLEVMRAEPADRADLFLTTARRLGAPLINIEKDFWVCWTLNTLYHRLPKGGPRLLFKGGTSLSKAYGLINRFSEDIDVTVFRDDLGHPGSTAEIAALSNKKRKAALDAIAADCSRYITTELLEAVAENLAADTGGTGRVEIDDSDPTSQTLLVWYPRVDASETGYVQAAVKIESGAKSALDPNRPVTIGPYIDADLEALDLRVPDVTTIHAERTFWDKIVIVHGLRSWFERRGELRQDGQRISRHYYDLHSLLHSDIGASAVADLALGADCIEHARTFFSRPDYDLAAAEPGTFALRPVGDMIDRLERDYHNTRAMIFGDAPDFEYILSSIGEIEDTLNRNT
ncbi:Nucleotidyl transferase AbiEii toxin, Type IV TA system [Roseovarius azorensis]|uniref:Nucleotidyl transferase AbiEii toxin, Type IV TA system n=1 Tax=Roseovarius azorensis TaxID=1287727 RepID=A0A1H7WU03_9RHOB|nr:nucleotidyl transferase AbiEii/AbiGii toxin family protein [Roseovarius azorensis]SEM24992.1 Nucleotidyl transferase AbiEii toxin, Type IV TA system [Roseovarius azorensis]